MVSKRFAAESAANEAEMLEDTEDVFGGMYEVEQILGRFGFHDIYFDELDVDGFDSW